MEITSASSHILSRTGRVVLSDSAKPCEKLIHKVDQLIVPTKLRALFDVVHDGGGFDVGVTEFCAALGGVYVRPLKYDIAKDMIADIQCEAYIDYAKIIREATNLNKYRLRPVLRTYAEVVFLPGSNLYDSAVDYAVVDKAVANGAVIKPHPITNWSVLAELQTKYGKDKVLNPKSSGYELLLAADTIYVGSTSELFMYAIAHDKKIVSTDKSTKILTSYRHPFEYLQSRNWSVNALNDMFNSKNSGIFFEHPDVEKDVKHYLKEVEKRYETYSDKSDGGNT